VFLGGRLILEELLGFIPTDIRQPLNMREVLLRLVDGSRMDEFKPLYGAGLVTAWAHIHGIHLNYYTY
jgi:acetyl-CoA carboxylase carboxyltransferase component